MYNITVIQHFGSNKTTIGFKRIPRDASGSKMNFISLELSAISHKNKNLNSFIEKSFIVIDRPAHKRVRMSGLLN